MKQFILAAMLLLTACGRTEQINPLTNAPGVVLDNQITDPEDCVYSTEVDPKGMYYNIHGYAVDGVLATSEVSCDDTLIQWLDTKRVPVRMLRA
jgi:hypothetical protein